MARLSKSYEGERRSVKVTIQLTPSERAALETGAANAGTNLSQHARELCLKRSAAAQIVAGTRRNPEARDLLNQLAAIGNNLNQLARLCNTAQTAPQRDELKRTTDLIAAAVGRVIAL
jgi:hypothetical protein